MIRKRSFRRLGVGADTGLTIAMQILGAVLNFVFQWLIVQSFIKADVGTYFLSVNFASLALGITDFGISGVLLPKMALMNQGKGPILKTAVILRLITAVFGALVIVSYVYAVGRTDIILLTVIGIIGGNITARSTGFRQIIDFLWRLQGRTYITGMYTVIEFVIQLVLVYVLYRTTGLTLVTLALIAAFSGLPSLVVSVIYQWSKMGLGEIFRHPIAIKEYRTMLIASLPVGMMVILGQSTQFLETFILELFKTRADIAGYNTATKPFVATLFISVLISAGVVPLISQIVHKTNSTLSLRIVVSYTVRVLLSIALLGAIVSLLFSVQLMTVFGPEYISEAYIMRYYSIINSVLFVTVFLDQLLLIINRRSSILYGAIVYLVVSLVLEVLTINQYGVLGILWSKIIGVICLLCFQLVSLDKELRTHVVDGLWRLAPVAVVSLLAVILTDQMSVVFRTCLVVAAFAVSLLVFRVYRKSEVNAVLKARLT